MIRIRNYTKQYGDQPILHIDSLDIEAKIYWVKGQNGAGKTTLFKSLSGMIPFSGDLSIDNIDLRKSPRDYRLAINYAEAEPVYPSFLSGLELVDFYASSKSADPSQVRDLLQYFNISNYLSNPVGTYSSGMMKKLSVLLAFVGKPRFILLDEPLVTIEDSFLPLIYDLIRKYHADSNTGFLISSHQALDGKHLHDYDILTVANQTVTCER